MILKILAFLFTLVSICNGASFMIYNGQTYSQETGYIMVSDWFGREIPKNTLDIYFQNDQPTFPELIIAAPFGKELQAQLYTGVVYYKQPSEIVNDPETNPSMELWIGGGRLYPHEGIVNVLEIEWADNGRLLKAAIDFQFSALNFVPNMGNLRYNSNIPVSVPEPSAPLLTFVGLAFVVRRKR